MTATVEKKVKTKKSHAGAKGVKKFYGTGRRKTSVARVFLTAGAGKVLVNAKSIAEYFCRETERMLVMQPLVAVNMAKKFDVMATVVGGGSSGQAGAVRLGIARALVQYDEGDAGAAVDVKDLEVGATPQPLSMRRVLRKDKLLTRDARMVERKKVGLRKARKAPQYSKR